MKRLFMKSLVSITASMLISPGANAAGIIMVDPVGGAVPTIAMIPMPPVHPPIMPVHPVHPLPPPIHPITPTVLKGSVSIGLHLQSEDIKVDINDQVAKTYITQTFMNDTDRVLAGTYLFPLPEDTTFSSFSLHIDGKPVEGQILEANEARQQYEEIVRRMVDPGLLEYADYKTVRARIFPIPPHGTKKVELEYTQVLKAENGMLKYRFPLKSEGQTTPVDEIKVDVKLSSKQGLRTIWSPSHTISSNKTDDHHAKVSLLSHDIVADKDFLLYYSVSDKDLTANLLTHKDEGEYGYFLMTLTPPVQSKQVIGKDIVLIADTSGSMAGEKMDQTKKALKYVVNALNANDRFDIVQFNTDVEKFKSQLQPATAENKKAAETFISELEARGGTNIGDALHTGTKMLGDSSERPAYLVLMTDGEPTVGETNTSKLVKLQSTGRDIRLFDFGVGYDVNTRLLNMLAQENHGTSQYVEPDEDIETSLSNFYQKIKSPVLTNVNIAYDGIEVKDVYPREVKDIFAGSQVLLIGKYKNGAKGTVKLTGKVNGEAKSFSFPLSFAADETGHTYLPRLWAMRRIGHLTDVAQENGNNREVIDEIVALSKKYGIISQYTSFLVTDPSENHRIAMNSPVPFPGAAPQMNWLVRGGMGSGANGMPGPAGSAVMDSQAAGHRLKKSVAFYGAPRQVDMIDNRPQIRDYRQAMAPTAFPVPVGVASGGGGYGAPMPQSIAHSGGPAFVSAQSVVSGRLAVVAAKQTESYKSTNMIPSDNEKDSGIKSVEDKTFYMKGGFWTDSDFDAAKSPKPEVITFGSKRYFELIHSAPGISKYLAVGQQAIILFKGRCYKIVGTVTTTG